MAAFHYGFSLLHVAQASKEVFVDKAEDEEPDEVGEETATDLSVAWEALECARRGLELTRDGCNHSRLAGQPFGVYACIHSHCSQRSTLLWAMLRPRAAILNQLLKIMEKPSRI